MKSLIKTTSFLAIIGLLVAVGVQGATTSAVTTTVTVQNISVSVADGTVTYGTLGQNSQEDTTSTGVDDSQTATNGGNVAEDFNIMGQNSAAWTLGAAAGSDIYVHEFCNNGTCDASPTWTALTTSYATLATSVATSGIQEFDLRINTPDPSSVFTEQSVDVTVQAVAS